MQRFGRPLTGLQDPLATTEVFMSVSCIGSSSVLQWLQTYLSSAGSATGSQSSCGCQSSSDTTSISQEAAQLNATQASQATDPSQTSGVNGSQGHHRHHHQIGRDGNSLDRKSTRLNSSHQK